jgi:hypothetical protein
MTCSLWYVTMTTATGDRSTTAPRIWACARYIERLRTLVTNSMRL